MRTCGCGARCRGRAALRGQVQPGAGAPRAAARARRPVRDRLAAGARALVALGVDPRRGALQQPGQAADPHRRRLRRRVSASRPTRAASSRSSPRTRPAPRCTSGSTRGPDQPRAARRQVRRRLGRAAELLLDGPRLGLRPHGLTFHVGSQALDPPRTRARSGWRRGDAERRRARASGSSCSTSAAACRRATRSRSRRSTPTGRAIGRPRRACRTRFTLVAEPGRALVAEAGVARAPSSASPSGRAALGPPRRRRLQRDDGERSRPGASCASR